MDFHLSRAKLFPISVSGLNLRAKLTFLEAAVCIQPQSNKFVLSGNINSCNFIRWAD